VKIFLIYAVFLAFLFGYLDLLSYEALTKT